MNTLTGLICIRNGDDLDYCWREAARSLLPAVDTLVICDGESTDGTREAIVEWQQSEPKIKLCVYPWPNPKGDISFWVDWLQFAKSHCPLGYLIQLDGDEVLHENSVPLVRKFIEETNGPRSAWCRRYNFWKDTRHLIPHGHCLSHRVVRLLPQDIYLPSDGPDPRGNEAVKMAVETDIEIFHYGFLRETDAFFRKSRQLQSMFFDSYDPRLAKVEGQVGWMQSIGDIEWTNNLIQFEGIHPAGMKDWLNKRGHII